MGVKFIDIECDNKGKSTIKEGYKRSLVNLSHIIRFEKEDNSEKSKVIVHLVDGTTYKINRTYESLIKYLEGVE